MTAIQLTSASVHDNLIALINESSQKEVKSQQVTFNDFATNGEDATVIVSLDHSLISPTMVDMRILQRKD